MIGIRAARTDADMDAIRGLFTEYQRWLGVDLCFQGFTAELAGLPGCYSRPGGCLLLAKDVGGTIAGGVGVRPLSAGVCEMKRLYVRPAWRRSGLGRRLAEAVVSEARSMGYDHMHLDSLRHLSAALTLYRSMGFTEISAYNDNPLPGVVYLSLPLNRSSR